MIGFEIDHKAFRAQNLGRPPQQLIREAIQNAFDEHPDHVTVTLAAAGRGIQLTVSDDAAGFKDEKEIWTIFASGKRDDPTKRGRLGRGLKELISVASEAEVLTAGKAVSFAWNGKTLTRSCQKARTLESIQRGTTGTTIKGIVPSWKKADLEKIVSYLRLFVPPEGTAMSVNGVLNERPVPEHSVPANVKTIVYSEDGVPEDRWRRTNLMLYRPGTGGRWIFEMGIPVEQIPDEDGFEWSIDVQQRVLLRPERDMLPRGYVHSLYAHVANALMDRLQVQEMTDLWMEEAVGHYDFDKAVGKVYVERRFGANAARAIVNDTHDRNLRCIENGLNVIRTEHLSASVRELVRNSLPSTADLYPIGCAEARYIPEAEWTDGERRFVGFGKWLTGIMRLSEPAISIIDAPGVTCQADSSASATRVRVNRGCLGEAFFARPRLSAWLPLIVHELAHRTGEGHDATYWREYERLAGEAAQAVREYPANLDEFGL